MYVNVSNIISKNIFSGFIFLQFIYCFYFDIYILAFKLPFV